MTTQVADISIEKYALCHVGPPKNCMPYLLLVRYVLCPTNWPSNLENICLIRGLTVYDTVTIQHRHSPLGILPMWENIQCQIYGMIKYWSVVNTEHSQRMLGTVTGLLVFQISRCDTNTSTCQDLPFISKMDDNRTNFEANLKLHWWSSAQVRIRLRSWILRCVTMLTKIFHSASVFPIGCAYSPKDFKYLLAWIWSSRNSTLNQPEPIRYARRHSTPVR